MPDTTLTSAELDDNAVAKAMEAFVSSVRGQDPEWTDEYDEEITLVSPSGDFFAPEYPIRDAIKAYLARAGLEAGKAEESMRERAALPDDLFSHQAMWRAGLVLAKHSAAPPREDEDDAAYWQHEIDVFDRVFAALVVLVLAVKEPK
jgi:hypothetical protein